MYTFPELIKKIRDEAGLTQAEFATAIGVSAVLIAMVETGQKEVSKKLLIKLAKKMNVNPTSITPFIFVGNKNPVETTSGVEQTFLQWGEKMQTLLIKHKAPLLKKYASK